MSKAKALYILIGSFILNIIFFILAFPSYGSDEVPKEIYVVYDTSGSMLNENEVSEYPWYETGYALELLVAMMEKNDVAYVYFMDDDNCYIERIYDYNSQEKVHDDLKKIPYTGHTYVDGLDEAIRKLKTSKNNSEKFLVILSDGEFNRKGGKEDRYRYTIEYKQEVEEALKSVDTEIIYLALSKTAEELFDDQEMSNCKTNVFCVTKKEQQMSGNARIFEVFTDMGNLIYDRRILGYEDKGELDGNRQIEFTADLPMRRLIILCQSESNQGGEAGEIKVKVKDTGEELTNISGNRTISGVKAEELESEKEGYAHYKISKGEKIKEGNYAGIYSIFAGFQGSIAKAGEYCLQVPLGTNVHIFVEYETEYRILMRSEGEQWELLERQNCLEGEYELEVQLFDTLRNAPITEDAKIYDDLNVNVTLDNQEEAESIPASRDWKLHLSEGTTRVRVTSQLSGNSSVVEEQYLTVNYRIKSPDINVVVSQNGFDIDKVGEPEQEKIHVTVTEDGRDISNYVDVSVDTSEGVNGNYQYVCEKAGTEWLIVPEQIGSPALGTDELIISVKAKGEQKDIWTKKVKVEYYAEPKSFDFAIINDEPKDIFGFYRQKITITLTLDGKPVGVLERGIEREVEGELKGEMGNRVELVRIGDVPLTYQISFKDLFTNWKLLNGGEIWVNIEISGLRYGQNISGILPLKVEVRRVRTWILIMALFAMYVILLSIIKCIFKYDFFRDSLEVNFLREFLDVEPFDDKIEHINRRWIKNMINPCYSEIVVPLENTGWGKVSELAIVQTAGGILRIKNSKELMETGEVFVGKEKISPAMEFKLDEGIELLIQIDNPIKLFFRRKRTGR